MGNMLRTIPSEAIHNENQHPAILVKLDSLFSPESPSGGQQFGVEHFDQDRFDLADVESYGCRSAGVGG
jgi:hypothetical protein